MHLWSRCSYEWFKSVNIQIRLKLSAICTRFLSQLFSDGACRNVHVQRQPFLLNTASCMQVLISTSQQQNYVIPQLKCVHLILNKTTGLINTRILHSASTSVTFSVTLANSVGMNYNNNYMIVLFISALFLPSLRIFHRHCLYLEIHQYTIECFTYMTMHLTQITKYCLHMTNAWPNVVLAHRCTWSDSFINDTRCIH